MASTNPIRLVTSAALVIVVLVVLVYLLLVLKFFKLWLQAKLSCAEVKWPELVGMWMRRSDYRTIVLSRITAIQGGVDLSTRALENHYLSGGRVANVVRAMILAKRKDIDLSWEQATNMDLDGRDVLKEVQSMVDSQGQPEAEGPSLHFGDVGEAVTVLEPEGQAKFGDVTVDVVA